MTDPLLLSEIPVLSRDQCSSFQLSDFYLNIAMFYIDFLFDFSFGLYVSDGVILLLFVVEFRISMLANNNSCLMTVLIS